MSLTPVPIPTMTEEDAERGAFVHAAFPSSKKTSHESLSRLQNAFNLFSESLEYGMGDIVVNAGIRYSNVNPVLVAGIFNPVDWEAFASPTTPLEAESIAVLKLSLDQDIDALNSDPIEYDQVFVDGDDSKIVNENNGIIRLHNGEFFLKSTNSITMDGTGSGNSAIVEWESSNNLGGPFNPIPVTQASQALLNTGRTEFSTQPEASGFIDAQAADVFVRAVLTPSADCTILHDTSAGNIQSHGTSAVANTPLTTLGDILGHDGIVEQREPIGTDNQELVVDDVAPNKIRWKDKDYELLQDVTLGVVANQDEFDITFPAATDIHIKMMLHQGGATNMNAEFNFNDDFGNNYAFRRTENMDYNGGTSDEVNADRVPLEPGTISVNANVYLDIIDQVGEETTFLAITNSDDGSVGVPPETQVIQGHWHNAAQVTKLNIRDTSSTPEFAANSRVLIYRGSK